MMAMPVAETPTLIPGPGVSRAGPWQQSVEELEAASQGPGQTRRAPHMRLLGPHQAAKATPVSFTATAGLPEAELLLSTVGPNQPSGSLMDARTSPLTDHTATTRPPPSMATA